MVMTSVIRWLKEAAVADYLERELTAQTLTLKGLDRILSSNEQPDPA
jgi:hypothetical protein